MAKITKVMKAYIKASVPNTETSNVLLKLLDDYLQGKLGGTIDAENVEYDPSESELQADNVQDAIDELANRTPVEVSKYQKTFTVSDWAQVGDSYEISISVNEHKLGVSPTVQVFETISGLEHKLITTVIVDSLGNIVLQVSTVPDNKFTGKVIIQ